jgi:peroxiredoxin
MLATGTPAPPMALQDTEGRTVRLADYQGRQPVLVYFMRSTSCPVCNRHVRDLVGMAGELADAGVAVLLAVPEDRERAAAWRTRRRIPFPVLAGGAPHEAVGLGRKVLGTMRQSGTVLIDDRGVVRHAHGATMPTGGFDKDGVIAAVAALGRRTD